jgi:hypothetical protein
MLRIIGYGALAMALSACEVVETSSVEQPGINMQGINMQGINLQGINLQGMNMLGYRFAGATLGGVALDHVRVLRGELVAGRGGSTLRGAALVGAQLVAEVRDVTVTPPATALVTYRISAISAEDSRYDPTGTGHTFLYSLDQQVDGGWQPACPADTDGRSVAIPLAAVWNEHGDRVESDTLFTFGCTTGVIAKCYRWGYRPWVNGFGNLVPMHQTCTRLARADYCGNGIPHTRNGTQINVWDNLPSPGPIQRHGLLPPLGMLFEAGWNTEGAVCLSHSRWLLDDALLLAALCPDRLVPPGLLGGTVCDTVPAVLGLDANARMFDEAFLNLIGP